MKSIVVLFLLISTPVLAADKALILNEQEQRELVNVLDIATKAQGLSIAGSALRLFFKLQGAGVVTEEKKNEEKKPEHEKPEPPVTDKGGGQP